MSDKILKGKWKQLTGDAKIWWGHAFGDPETELEGNKDKIVGWVQEHYGYAEKEAKADVESFTAALEKMKEHSAEIEEEIMKRYERFTHDDIQEIEGKMENWAEKIKEKYKKTQEEANTEIKEFISEFKK